MPKSPTRFRVEPFEYQLPNSGKRLHMFAGPSSIQTFRDNFYNRLAEVFYNLDYQYSQQNSTFRIEEFKAYEKLFQELQEIYTIPNILVKEAYEILRRKIDDDSKLNA